MKFSWKVFFSSLLVIALSFGAGGGFLISSVFQSSLNREIKASQEAADMLQFSFETAIASLPGAGIDMGADAITDIAKALLSADQHENRFIRVSNDQHQLIYASRKNRFDNTLLNQVSKDKQGYRVFYEGGRYYVQTACVPYMTGQEVYLESFRDITPVFEERTRYYHVYRNLMVLILAVSGLLMFFLSRWLTQPIRALSAITREIAQGAYQKRAQSKGRDEVGQLARDFNTMADTLQARMNELEDAARRQEDFVASFAHEMKTPMTSIIGYADIIRSRDLTFERRQMAANYIFSEGKRLEALSLKMMEMIVMHRQEFQLVSVDANRLFENVCCILEPVIEKYQFSIKTNIDAGSILCEPDLLKTLLYNLIDNARKVTPVGGVIELSGKWREEGVYEIAVADSGLGMEKEELKKITEAFYMVDKSRSRASGGAGLGLAICSEIARLHGTQLEFESEVGKGTTVRIRLKGELQ